MEDNVEDRAGDSPEGGVSLDRVLSKIARRARLNSFILRASFFSMIFAFAAVALVAGGRLGGFIPPGTLSYGVLLAPLALGFAVAFFLHKAPGRFDAARMADDSLDSKDLFQTAVSIRDPDVGYARVSLSDAEDASARIKPEKSVPFTFHKRLWILAFSLLLLAVCVRFVPRCDPFGRDEARKRAAENRRRSEKIAKSVERRLDVLKNTATKNSPEVEKLLREVKENFNKLRKSRMGENEKSLKRAKSALDEMWRRKASERLADKTALSLGRKLGVLGTKERAWLDQMKKRDYSGIKKEIDEIRRLAADIASTSDPAEREKKKEELKKRLEKLRDFVASRMGSKSAQSALQSALQQLNMAGMPGVNQAQALKSLGNALNLAGRELQRLQQQANDISNLEMASKACQLARELNKLKAAMAANASGLQSMEDYAKFYQECVAKCKGKGKRKKPGSPGGGGGKVPENDKAKTSMKDERSSSHLQPGKIIASWKVKGQGKKGEAEINYTETRDDVKQDVNEAILKEEVPPGYHDTIKQYFKNTR